jgi:hypothetical protein
MIGVWSSLVKLPAVDQFGRRSCTIYALIDPREPSIWRYIGRSFRPDRRRFQHMHQSRCVPHSTTQKARWIRRLSSAGLPPSVLVLESGIPLRDARAREQFWIRRALQEGHPLTNAVRYCKSVRCCKCGPKRSTSGSGEGAGVIVEAILRQGSSRQPHGEARPRT